MSALAEKQDAYYVLNGRKVFISNGKIASVLIVLAKTERNLSKPSKGIAMFIVDCGFLGVSIGNIEELMRVAVPEKLSAVNLKKEKKDN